MGTPFLDSVLGKLYARGEEKELRGGLNIGPGLLLTPSAQGYDITPDPAVYVAALRSEVQTTNATPTLLTDLAQTVPEATMYRIEARFFGRGETFFDEKFLVQSAVYRRVNAGALSQWGSTSTGFDEADDATWVCELYLSGNTVTPRVTGTAINTINWTVDLVVRAY
jgi:hypothetical protein